MYKVEISNRARKELSDSYNWYEDQKDGLGDRFEKAVYHSVEAAAKAPEIYAVRHKNYRQIQMKKIPFVLVFRIQKKTETILISSVFHTKRNPQNKYRP